MIRYALWQWPVLVSSFHEVPTHLSRLFALNRVDAKKAQKRRHQTKKTRRAVYIVHGGGSAGRVLNSEPGRVALHRI